MTFPYIAKNVRPQGRTPTADPIDDWESAIVRGVAAGVARSRETLPANLRLFPDKPAIAAAILPPHCASLIAASSILDAAEIRRLTGAPRRRRVRRAYGFE
jgi:hypothetical protein